MYWVITQAILFTLIIFLPIDSQLTVPAWISFLVSVLTIIGFLILVRAIYDLRLSLSVSPTPVKNGQLQTHGIYAWVRHPMYLSVWLIFGSSVLQSGSYIKYILFGILVLFFIVKIKHEERLLRCKYPEYGKYMKHVGAFLPKKHKKLL